MTNTDQFGNVCIPHPACLTGDCNGLRNCPVGVGGSPPVSLAEFFLTEPPKADFYDVSNVDGYAVIAPTGTSTPENIGAKVKPVTGTFVPPAESETCTSDADCVW